MNFRMVFDMLSTLFRTFSAFLREACCHFAPPKLPLLAKRGEGRGEGMLSILPPTEDCCKATLSTSEAQWRGAGGEVCAATTPKSSQCPPSPPKKYSYRRTNRNQREFYSNGAIPPFAVLLASNHPRQKTNLFKPFVLLPSLAKRGRRAVTSRRRQRRAVTSRRR
jgi:hypothetical protein